MRTLTLTPIELCRLSLGDDWEIARIAGVSRAQTVQRWSGIPGHHIPKLIEASRRAGRFSLTSDMLIFGGSAHIEPAEVAQPQVDAPAENPASDDDTVNVCFAQPQVAAE